jgi:hypothetical protein
MTTDYGVTAGSCGPGIRTTAVVVNTLFLAILFAGLAWWSWNHGTLESRAWTVAGPACPAVSRAGYLASGSRLAHPFIYAGARFDRADGYVMCNVIADRGGHGAGRITVCQFSNPSALEAVTPRGDFLFLTQAYPATIAVDHGRPSCVLKARVSLDWLMK